MQSLFAADLAFSDADRRSLPRAEVIVVDSASTDGSSDMVRAKYPLVTLLPQRENVGFTRGNNIGLARATGEYLLLLNPDTEVRPDCIKHHARLYECAVPGRHRRTAHTQQRWQPSVHAPSLPNPVHRHIRKYLAVILGTESN